jgi:hypothetical protein
MASNSFYLLVDAACSITDARTVQNAYTVQNASTIQNNKKEVSSSNRRTIIKNVNPIQKDKKIINSNLITLEERQIFNHIFENSKVQKIKLLKTSIHGQKFSTRKYVYEHLEKEIGTERANLYFNIFGF